LSLLVKEKDFAFNKENGLGPPVQVLKLEPAYMNLQKESYTN